MRRVNKTLKKKRGGDCGCNKSLSFFNGGSGFSTPPTMTGSVPGYSYNNHQNDPLSPNNIINSRLDPNPKMNGGKKRRKSKFSRLRSNEKMKNVKRTSKKKRKSKKTRGGTFLNSLAGFSSNTSNYYTHNLTSIPVGTPSNQPHASIISGNTDFRTF